MCIKKGYAELNPLTWGKELCVAPDTLKYSLTNIVHDPLTKVDIAI